MITEDYISFEIAKLLKDKGFNEDIDLWYDENGEMFFEHKYDIGRNWRLRANKKVYECPTLQMIMKWLRETHKWTICIGPYWAEGDMRNKLTWYYDIHSLIDNRSFRESSYTDNYTEACENAIKYCLEHLI